MLDQPTLPADSQQSDHDCTRTQAVSDYDGDVPPTDGGRFANASVSMQTMTGVVGPSSGASLSKTLATRGPTSTVTEEIGRYRVEKTLGEGGFGIVYLAHDDQLKRRVAIKVPQERVIRGPADIEKYLIEAQIVARLEHPNIVPVYDVGRTSIGLPFIVSRYVEGCNLSERIKQSRFAIRDAVQLIIRMAEALEYAHAQKLVHRDVKPANILLEDGSKPFLVDFGLALREEDINKRSDGSGTPAYMSPEQANNEGHLVDGRSDIYSLGVILYELLTGVRPHIGATIDELLALISNTEPRSPRQVDPSIPPELERITMKALAKRASDRYSSARELAEDLRYWLHPEAVVPHQDPGTAKIVPKGLRSFDAGDTDFFLGLLPGPRDREGLPESLRFWKTRIEETDPAKTFRVGVIYGPSGCGKSSFVKAGLLPRLAERVRVVYVEATPEDTETRLLRGLERACPELPKCEELRDAIGHLRRLANPRRKVVLVVDQFEQWLHGGNNQENAELVHALRQCDGEQVQCVLMVRDDFWLALSRFMERLEIPILGRHNATLIDLFDLNHASNVLAAFGRAYGTLRAEGLPNPEQAEFLKSAVAGLAQDEKVISVRIALFAEMMKGRPWTPASLAEVGGTDGIGLTFLEETFCSRSAPPKHRLHQEAAKGLLRALLPGTGTDIKGTMRSHVELQLAAGDEERPKEFEDLISILDGDLRLITPTDPEGKDPVEAGEMRARNADSRYYQLTHDFLVPSLREWLTRKQRETQKGRTELLLEDRSEIWNARPENRQLPTLSQWLRIRRFVPKKNWTPAQAKMMRQAGRYHGMQYTVFGTIVAMAAFAGLMIREQMVEQRNRSAGEGMVWTLLNSETSHVPEVIRDMAPYRRWALPAICETAAESGSDSRQRLHCALAMLEDHPEEAQYLYARMLKADPQELMVIRTALASRSESLLEPLWTLLEKPEKRGESQRIRAAAALAVYDPDNERWATASKIVAEEAVRQNPNGIAAWSEALRPIRTQLTAPLSAIAREPAAPRRPARLLATKMLSILETDRPEVLADLLMDADEQQFAALFPVVKELGEKAIQALTKELTVELPRQVVSADPKRDTLAKRQVNAAIALLRMNETSQIWPLLRLSPDPRVRSYFIHRLSPFGADPQSIMNRLDEEPDVSVRRALLMCLGEFTQSELPEEDREALLPKIREIYQSVGDAGLHASAEWLLRTWKQDAWLSQTNADWAKDKQGRERKIQAIKDMIARDKENAPLNWYVNSLGQTFVVIPGPVTFTMGSPETERNHNEFEQQHQRRIGRSFAIANKSVTIAQFKELTKNSYLQNERYTYHPDLPVVFQNWTAAARFCDRLSKAEGIPEDQCCYVKSALGDVIRLKENYLQLSGYRMPTEAEMEYAIRAKTTTRRYYGESEELLDNYVWHTKNSRDIIQRVGVKKPNDFGLFDSLGNCNTWCLEQFRLGPKYEANSISEDIELPKNDLTINSSSPRIVRGGAFFDRPETIRSAARYFLTADQGREFMGIRVVRTITP